MPPADEIAPSGGSAVTLSPRWAVRALPVRQARWVGVQAVLTSMMALWWTTQPEIVAAVGLAGGAAAVNPRKLWAFPLLAPAAVSATLLAQAAELPGIVAAALVCGAAAAWLLPEPTDALDHLNAALGSVAGSSIGLLVATAIVPAAAPAPLAAGITGALVGLAGSQALWPLALRFDNPQLPSAFTVIRTLRSEHRAPVNRALELYQAAKPHTPDARTRRGLAEVATWVFRLQSTRQTLEDELQAIDTEGVRARIAAAEAVTVEDSFTRERNQATAGHLRRLLQHAEAISAEIGRNRALVEYALAFLEEARAGLVIARQLPGETLPDRLPEVLGRLRTASDEGDARRRTVREIGKLEGS